MLARGLRARAFTRGRPDGCSRQQRAKQAGRDVPRYDAGRFVLDEPRERSRTESLVSVRGKGVRIGSHAPSERRYEREQPERGPGAAAGLSRRALPAASEGTAYRL